MSIFLPVSLGEALDKLTILDIKLTKIKDDRKHDVEHEYKILNEELSLHIQNNKYYYELLKNINLKIWELQDEFRYSDCNQNEICKQIILDNDRRFRVKNKINNSTKSLIKEQKGYHKNTAFVLSHLGLGDCITAIGMVRYLTTCYDKVIVVCFKKNQKNLELFYNDDSDIQIYPVDNDSDISPRFGCPYDKFKHITKGMDLFLCGMHCKNSSITNIPYSFYHDVGVDESIFWDYFYIPSFPKSQLLYNLIKDQQYIFIHNTSSQGKIFDLQDIKINKDNILVINPCYNMYDQNHKFFKLANNFINHVLITYVDLIINANKIFVCDSSFMCLAINLEIITTECYYYARNKTNYEYLYKNGIPKSKQKFVNF